MSQAIRARILSQIRQRIEAGVDIYICFALDAIEREDFRRNVHKICGEIRADVKAHLGPYPSFGDKLRNEAAHYKTVKSARLAWLDDQIKLAKEAA